MCVLKNDIHVYILKYTTYVGVYIPTYIGIRIIYYSLGYNSNIYFSFRHRFLSSMHYSGKSLAYTIVCVLIK